MIFLDSASISVEILRMCALWLGLWILSGLWADALLLRHLFNGPVRALLLPICGVTTHMIAVLNLSYAGIEVRRGWWIALIVSLLAFLAAGRKCWTVVPTLKKLGFPLFLVTVAVLIQSSPLIKVGILTTAPAENGDWITYVSHADILVDHSYGWVPPGRDYAEHNVHIDQYVSANFRYGASHLLASSSVTAGVRGIFNFNVFCGCLLGLGACALSALAWQLRLGRNVALLLGVAGSFHPSLHWVGLASFMPQLVGTFLALSLFAASPLLITKRNKVTGGVFIGLLLCGLFVGYNEMIPLVVAICGLGVIAMVKFQWSRWKGLLTVVGIAGASAVLFSPLGIMRGVKGLLLQMKISKTTGGSEQAVGEFVYFIAAELGFLPLPPLANYIAVAKQSDWWPYIYPAVLAALAGCALLLVLGTRKSMRGRRLILPCSLAVFAGLAVYISSTYELVQFRTWGLFKLEQYALPLLLCLMAAGTSTGRPRLRHANQILALLLMTAVAAQAVIYFRGFPKSPLTANLPRYGSMPTTVDMELIEAVNRLVPAGQPILSQNNLASIRDVTVSLLLYPRVVIAPDTVLPDVFAKGVTYSVEDKNHPVLLTDSASLTLVWENARFRLSRLSQDDMYLTLANPKRKLLSPITELYIPRCTAGHTIAFHGYAPEAVELRALSPEGGKLKLKGTIPVNGGEFIFQIPVNCSGTSARVQLQADAPMFLADHELVKTKERQEALRKVSAELQGGGEISANLLPMLGDNSRWSTRLLDGTKSGPQIATMNDGIKITSNELVSGGLQTAVTMGPGWYELEIGLTVTDSITGAGKGLGMGFLDSPDSQLWLRERGSVHVRKYINVSRIERRGFGLILGGFGTAKGGGIVTHAALRRVKLVGGGQEKTPIPIPPFSSHEWVPVVYDNAKTPATVKALPNGFSLSSANPTAGGMAVVLNLPRGTYRLGARIDGQSAAAGPGVGYGVLLEGQEGSILTTKKAGALIGQKIFSIPKEGRYRMAVVLGGYGMSQGHCTITDITLDRISTGGLGTTPAANPMLELAALDNDNWKLQTLDPTPAQVQLTRNSNSLELSGAGPISAAMVSAVKVPPGLYILQADIFASQPAEGPGRGYGVGFLGSSEMQWYIRGKGAHRVQEMFQVEKSFSDGFALIVGGFGAVQGTARFSPPVILTLRYASLKAVR